VYIPVDPPLQSASGEIGTAPLLLLDVTDTDGATGRAYIMCYVPAVLAAAHAFTIALASMLPGGPIGPRAVAEKLPRRVRLLGRVGIAGMVLGGLDMALWDLAARHAGMPLARLLGGDLTPLPAYASLRSASPARISAEAAEAAAAGFSAFKVRVGHGSLRDDLAAVQAVRDGAGEAARVMIDYNQVLTVPEAIARSQSLADYGIEWIEEPVAANDPAGHARITRASPIPVQLGENWQSPQEVAHQIAAGASTFAMLDAMNIGGVTGWLTATALAQAGGLPISSHMFPEISAHLLAATAGRHWLEWLDLAAPVLQKPRQPTAGQLTPSAEAGTGVDWDKHAIMRWLAG
jgi:mandelate racemase